MARRLALLLVLTEAVMLLSSAVALAAVRTSTAGGASDDVYLGSQQGMAVVGEGGGSADVLNLEGPLVPVGRCRY